MRIVIAGGTGFLGSALSRRLARDGHTVVVLTRDRDGASGGRELSPAERAGSKGTASSLIRYVSWTPNGESGAWAQELDGADAVVNLAGAGLADKRWTAARKRVLRQSRLSSTRSLANAMRTLARRPATFLQASAEGYYGSFETGPTLDETSPPGSDFLASLCVAWEAEAQPIGSLGCRMVYLRTGLVLSRDGGALAKLVPPFKAFIGGPLASGRQYMSWIHLDDWVGMVIWALGNAAVTGPLNLTAPHPVTNAEFSRALGRALHRPSWIPVPGFVLRIVVGEMATEALIRGQRILPRRALELGYVFHCEQIDEAMKAAVGRR